MYSKNLGCIDSSSPNAVARAWQSSFQVLRSYPKFDIALLIRLRRCCIHGSDALSVCIKDYKSTLAWYQTGKRRGENVVEVTSLLRSK